VVWHLAAARLVSPVVNQSVNATVVHVVLTVKVKKVEVRIAPYGLETPIGATERHLPYRITQCYLPPDMGERTPP